MRLIVAGGLVALGYFLGSSQVFRDARAQQEEELPSEEAVKKIGDAYNALKTAAQMLQAESRYSSITKAVNPYSIQVGGINVKADLESGQGVDPETFAALSVAAYDRMKKNVKDDKSDNEDEFADWAIEKTNLKESLIDKLGYDNSGRLTYDNKIVKMYSISKLRKMNAQRSSVLNMTREHKTVKQK
jgi:hypothetical protein